MTSTSTRLVLAMALALPLACGEDDDDANDLDPRQAQTSWAAANHATATAHSDFATHVVPGEHGDVSLACDDGGLLHMSGTMTGNNDVHLDVTYDDCVEDGVMINGDLSIVAVVDVDIDVELDDDDDAHDDVAHHDVVDARVVVDYDGVLQLDGDVEGTCVIDAEVSAHALLFEHFASAGVTVEGTVCGHEADDVIHA